MSGSYETVEKLLGDFFEHNTAGDKDEMKNVLNEIQQKLDSGEIDSIPFKDYFNNMYAGRGAINMTGIARDYPHESIIRELFQNVFGCDYDTPDIKVMVEFLDEGQVKLTYNETGFSLAQVFYYLSVGRNEGDKRREGRFGLGAKSVFANVDWFKMRSNDYSLRVVNDEGTLKVRELELKGQHFPHTEIVFALPENEQAALHENLVSLTSKKGLYINMVDLCFAFIRKKWLKSTDEEECLNRTINLAVINFGKAEVVYKIQRYQRDENDIPKVRFFESGKSVADFLHAEHDGFTYLIPYAISGAKREAAKVLMSKYNYFSTFELTGFVRSNNQDFVNEQLSAFFVSVPNTYITNNRSGIKYDSLEECSSKIEKGILTVAEEYKRLFVLEMTPLPDAPDRYTLRPNQYVFEFFYNYVNNSSIVKGLREKFGNSVSVMFPDGGETVTFQEMRDNGFFSEKSSLSKEEHEDGSAAKSLFADIEQMNEWYGKDDNHVLCARYSWNVPGTDEGGREFLYSFYRNGKQYFIESNGNARVKDYELGATFKSIISLKLNECIVNGSVADENALADVFKLVDEMFGEDYRISMKYFQLVVTSGTTSVQFEIAKINIGNLKKVYDTLSAHEMRFENHQIFNQVIRLMVDSFTNGKDTVEALKEIRSQGGDVTLALDINKRYRFSVFGKQFMIPPNITNAELLDIVGDVYSLIESGMFNNREFDFPCVPGRFSFDAADMMSVLPEIHSPVDAEEALSKIYVCDMDMNGIALLDSANKLMKIVDMSVPIDDEDKAKTVKYVVLRDNLSKPQYAGYVEYILTGTDKGALRGLYSGTEEPNIMLIDQLPYYYKPVPEISRKEFDYIRGEVRRIEPYRTGYPKHYRNFFSRDINAKLFGYGSVCPCCGYESRVLNSFVVKEFSIGLMNGDKERKFNFALYLCHNDADVASGWLIDDISIGGMSPFLWLEEITQIDRIPPEFLYCRLKFRRQVTYNICEPTSVSVGVGETIYEGSTEVLDFVLSPMMAAKWFEDNTGKPAPQQEAPVQAAPRQANPAQTAPQQANPAQAAPQQANPAQAAPQQANPVQAAPQQVAPQQAQPQAPRPKPHAAPMGSESPQPNAPRRPAPQTQAPGAAPMQPRYPAPEGVKPRKPRLEPMYTPENEDK